MASYQEGGGNPTLRCSTMSDLPIRLQPRCTHAGAQGEGRPENASCATSGVPGGA
jgi:hypothetical protein